MRFGKRSFRKSWELKGLRVERQKEEEEEYGVKEVAEFGCVLEDG